MDIVVTNLRKCIHVVIFFKLEQVVPKLMLLIENRTGNDL